MQCCEGSHADCIYFHGHADVAIVAVAVIAVMLGVAAYVVAEGMK